MRSRNLTIWVMAIVILRMTGISSGDPVYLSMENIGLLPIRDFYVGFDIAPPASGIWDFAVMTPGYEDTVWNRVLGDYTILPLDDPIAPGEIYYSAPMPQLEDVTFGVRDFGFKGPGYSVGWQSYYWEWTLDQSCPFGKAA